MGLYDYIGTAGDQVKCFYVPCIAVNMDSNPPTVNFGTSGGRLGSVNNAPYMTAFYNYGKDFAILSCEFIWEGRKAQIFVVRDGKWSETLYVSDIPDTYDLPSTVIGYYGTRYNAHNTAELKQMVSDYIEADDKFNKLYDERLAQNNLTGRFMDFKKAKQMPHDDLLKEIAIRDEISKNTHQDAYGEINKRWLDKSHESDVELVGLVYEEWLWQQAPDRWKHPDEEWAVIIDELYKQFANIGDPLVVYKSWCEKEGIVVNHDEVEKLFAKYRKSL